MRHATAGPAAPGTGDFDRRLDAGGVDQAIEMGRRLARSGLCVQRVVSSEARRALDTARILATELGFDKAMIESTRDAYGASAGELAELLREFGPEVNAVVLVAHNPGITEICSRLCAQRTMSMPPAGVALLRLDIHDWSELGNACGRLEAFESP